MNFGSNRFHFLSEFESLVSSTWGGWPGVWNTSVHSRIASHGSGAFLCTGAWLCMGEAHFSAQAHGFAWVRNISVHRHTSLYGSAVVFVHRRTDFFSSKAFPCTGS